MDRVLVTGGSGYIGGWCIARLLADGYEVHTTIRSLQREAEVRRALATVAPSAAGEKLRVFAADLLSDDGWTEAAAGCRHVLHVASPLGASGPNDPQALIRPAREGALRALRAARAAGAERVVMTSSVAAVSSDGPAGTFDETRWTDPQAKGVGAYAQSKTLAERAAWDFIKTEGTGLTLATVQPALVVGPVMSADFSGSVEAVSRLLRGQLPGLPNFGFCYVDVRDVADLHVRAMLAPQAAGERFIAAADFLWLRESADLLRRELGAAARKVPTRRLPDFAVRIVALFDQALGVIINELSRKAVFSSAKASQVLGWRPRPAREAILDCARSLIEHKLA
jgi:nucleoside-diphosphate-sugar epimerase